MHREAVILWMVFHWPTYPIVRVIKVLLPGRCPLCFARRSDHTLNCAVNHRHSIPPSELILKLLGREEQELTGLPQ